jgi:hypothetical protein
MKWNKRDKMQKEENGHKLKKGEKRKGKWMKWGKIQREKRAIKGRRAGKLHPCSNEFPVPVRVAIQRHNIGIGPIY